MVRNSIRTASIWAGVTLLAMSGSASAQWMPFSGNCGCNGAAPRSTLFGPPPMSQVSCASCSAAMPVYQSAYHTASVECGQPISCQIEQPIQVQAVAVRPMVQTVRVEPLQPIMEPVYDNVQVTEYHPVKQTVQRPVVEVDYVDQAVTVMRPVTTQKTVNVPTVDYQSVTEYKQVQKEVGYWATKTEPTGKVAPCQYDNRPGFSGWMNRTSYQMRTAFTPNTRTTRQWVPQKMTCTVPCTKKVAVQGMKQVTYNVTQMVPTQTTQKVAVSKTRMVDQEVTVMKPITVSKRMQIGTRVSYAPAGSSNGGRTALQPTPDNNASARNPDGSPKREASNQKKLDEFSPGLDPNSFNDKSGGGSQGSYRPTPAYNNPGPLNAVSENVIPARRTESKDEVVAARSSTPSVIRVSHWVARASSSPVPTSSKAANVALAGNVP